WLFIGPVRMALLVAIRREWTLEETADVRDVAPSAPTRRPAVPTAPQPGEPGFSGGSACSDTPPEAAPRTTAGNSEGDATATRLLHAQVQDLRLAAGLFSKPVATGNCSASGPDRFTRLKGNTLGGVKRGAFCTFCTFFIFESQSG